MDYNTVISLGFVNKTFHYVVLGNLAALAMQQSLTLTFATGCLAVIDDHGVEVANSACTPAKAPFVASVQALTHKIVPHAVTRMNIRSGTWLALTDDIFDALPALRFVEHLILNYTGECTENTGAFLSKVSALKLLRLVVYPRATISWSRVLRTRCALGLEERILSYHPDVHGYDEIDILRYCFDFSCLADGASKIVRMRRQFSLRFFKNLLRVMHFLTDSIFN